MFAHHFNNIDDFLKELGLPPMKMDGFYIAKFEEHNFKITETPFSYTHDFFEISLSVGYDAEVSINDKVANALDFNLSFVSPRQIVTWGELKRVYKKSSSYILLFKPEFLSYVASIFSIYKSFTFFNHNTLSSFQLKKEQIQLFSEQLQVLNKEHQLLKEDSIELIKAYLNIFLLKAKRELKFNKEVSYLRTRVYELTYNFENLIKETKHKYHPIKFYADKLNVSPLYLSECIKKATNKTAKQVIDEYIILEAKSLLKQSTQTIVEIAFILGFEDSSNFTKYFKVRTGLTPKQFQNKP